jgi:hypothetical protein
LVSFTRASRGSPARPAASHNARAARHTRLDSPAGTSVDRDVSANGPTVRCEHERVRRIDRLKDGLNVVVTVFIPTADPK